MLIDLEDLLLERRDCTLKVLLRLDQLRVLIVTRLQHRLLLLEGLPQLNLLIDMAVQFGLVLGQLRLQVVVILQLPRRWYLVLLLDTRYTTPPSIAILDALFELVQQGSVLAVQLVEVLVELFVVLLKLLLVLQFQFELVEHMLHLLDLFLLDFRFKKLVPSRLVWMRE
jgi:hypothetical protein